ncbi:MAG: 30S ribosomal protein S13 [Microgenomates group bacterium ADurb.Bin219]|nr:MAG: 30S ribosomal protein S13 [Microgenomates group bacterium ADurb.Bin219]HNP89198.1 30S ribosomal protein S13 [Candidatus Woesebacteria bacterium]
MIRIAGVDLQDNKIVRIGLTKIFGLGRSNVEKVLQETGIEGGKRIKELTDEEVSRIQKFIDAKIKVEGDLRQEIQDNIFRLKRIAAYRGKRHAANLPVRGQRTRTNARTKRGKRVTIGALKKEALNKIEQAKIGSDKQANEKK